MKVSAPPVSTAGRSSTADERLWRRLAIGLVAGFVVVGVLGFITVSLVGPQIPVLGRVGFGLFLAFWSSPFVGLSGGVGYHQMAERRR